MNNAELPLNVRKAMAIIQSAGDENGWMSEEEYNRTQAELRELGVVTTMEDGEGEDEPPATDERGWTFFEVSIHPFVEQVADEEGKPVNGHWSNTSGGTFSAEFGHDPNDYPDTMFRKGWSVSSWVRDGDEDEDGEYDGEIDCVDDEDFPDYDTAMVRAEELAAKYRVEIDHRY